MIYLDLPSIVDFHKEIKSQKIREIRMTPYMRSQPDQQGQYITEISIILTAAKGNQIIRLQQTIGRDYAANAEAMKAMQDAADKTMKDFRSNFRRSKILVKSGIYKFPQEIA